MVSVYFVERAEVCKAKTNLELVCSDGLGGNDQDLAYVISKDNKQSQIFLDQKEAEVKKNLVVCLSCETSSVFMSDHQPLSSLQS